MTRDFIHMKVLGGLSDPIASRTQNISDKRVFSDLLGIAKEALRKGDAIYNEDDVIIYAKGPVWEGNIRAIVLENHDIADICFDQALFESIPTIEIIFNYYHMDFSFMKGGTKQKCNLEYLYGSKDYCKVFFNDVRNKEECFEHKLSQKYLRDRFGSIMEEDVIALNGENCAVFIVHPLAPLKGDILTYLDNEGIIGSTKNNNRKDAILFRDAGHLKKSLQKCLAGSRSSPLPNKAIYLILFPREKVRTNREN